MAMTGTAFSLAFVVVAAFAIAMLVASAAAAFKILASRDAAQFVGLHDVLADGFLDFLHLFLSFDERLGDGVGEERVAFLVEGGDFRRIQFQAFVLFLMQRAAFFAQALVLCLSGGVSHEGFDALADGQELGLREDDLAKFDGLDDDRIFFR